MLLHTRVRRVRLRGIALLGPAFVAAAAYLDPGNVATNTTAGARYGYLLVWVVVTANVMAGLVQYLSAKLGVVTGRSLPEELRDRLRPAWRVAYWVQAELVCVATDLAEVLGGAIALHLLLGMPLLLGGVVTVGISLVVLGVADRHGQRRFEQVVTSMLAVVAVGFIASLVVRPPSPGATVAGLVPAFADSASLLLATGILGATVMPHAVYLHGALARDRHGPPPPGSGPGRLLAATRVDVAVALLLAGGVNLALMLIGATALRGQPGTDSLDGVHAALGLEFGPVVGALFAVALLFSGLASTSVGCYAGSVIMSGLLRFRVSVTVRRVVTAVPALLVLAGGADPTRALILSQVVLSFGIPFALVPLIVLTSRRAVMGADANGPAMIAVAGAVAVTIIVLNVLLLVLTLTD